MFLRYVTTILTLISGVNGRTVELDSDKQLRIDARNDAKRDAKSNFKRLSWFFSGVGIGAVGCVLGLIGGCAAGEMIDPSTGGGGPGYYLPDISIGALIGGVVGPIVAVLVPILVLVRLPVGAASVEFVEKLPEYVESYISTYKTEIQSLRRKWAIGGAAVGCVLLITSICVMIWQILR